MSLESCEKLLTSLNIFRLPYELSGGAGLTVVGKKDEIVKRLDGKMTYWEHNDIYFGLKRNGIFSKEIYSDTDCLFVIINKNKFYKLCNGVEERIRELKEFSEVKVRVIQKEEKSENKESIKFLGFDGESSILTIGIYKIKISLRKSNPSNAHQILDIIAKDIKEEYDYIDLAKEIFGVDEEKFEKEKFHNKIITACEDIKEKIEKGTNLKISDFIVFSYKQFGSVKINEKYL